MNKLQFTKLAFGLSALLMAGSATAQTADEIVKAKFPEVTGDLAITENTQYNKALKDRYRELFYKMSTGLAEIEKVEAIGAASEVPDLEVFDAKTLKDMQKGGQLADLKSALHAEQRKITNLMRDEKYGADSALCIRNLSMFSEYMKQQALEDAYPSWNVLFHDFPNCSQNLYSNGVSIVKKKMATAANGKEQQLWVDTLMMVYDMRIKYFAPTSKLYGEAYCLGRKGVDLLKYRKQPVEEPYNVLVKAVELGNDAPDVVQCCMQATIGMYTSEKIDASIVVDRYLMLADKIANKRNELNEKIASASDDKTKAAAEKELGQYNTIQASVDNLFSTSTAAQCDVLVKAFTGRFQENPNDLELCDKIIKILGSKGCNDTQLYEDVVSKVVQSNPTEGACAGFAKMLDKKGKQDDAITYYEKAISLAQADTMKSAYNLAIAAIYAQKKAHTSACSYAKKAVALNPNSGAAYIIIATSYAAVPVGDDDFERSKTFWVVIDKLQRAKSVDPSVAPTAQKLINQFIGHCPKKEEAFMHGVTNGSTVTIGGWIGETTTARF